MVIVADSTTYPVQGFNSATEENLFERRGSFQFIQSVFVRLYFDLPALGLMTDVDVLLQSANQPVSLTNGLGGTNHQPPILVSVNSSGRT